jgi:membrane protease YdiL (CAAX protease family)
VVVSSVAFALGHAPAQWLAASAYGLLMAGLWIVRRDLVAPITAHATTNLVLYLYVYVSGNWGLW